MKIKKTLVILCVLFCFCLILTSCDSIIATALKTIGEIKNVAENDTPTINIHEHGFEIDSDETGHWEVCSCGEKKEKSAHTYEYEVTTPSTCKDAGIKTGTCTVCSYQTTEALPLSEHTYGAWNVTLAATAQSDGEKERFCTVCSNKETGVIQRLDALTPLPANMYYGYKTLEAKGEKFITVYNLLVDNVPLMPEKIDIPTDLAITKEELQTIFNCYHSDYPQHFWIDGSYTYSYNISNIVTGITPTYTVNSEDLPALVTAFNNAVSYILSGVKGTMTDYQKELIIHDAIVRNAQYDESREGTLTHTAYANLVLHSSVCDGYAGAFQYLLYCCGIQALSVTGHAGDEAHAWNIVKIDGFYYVVDVTWDDPVGQAEDEVSHEYLNMSDTMISINHYPSVLGYTYPECNKTTYNYFFYNGYTSEFKVAQLGACFAKIFEDTGEAKYEIYLTNVTALTREDVDAFMEAHKTEIFTYATNASGKKQKTVSYSIGTTEQVITFIFGE